MIDDPDFEAALAVVDRYYALWRECVRSLPVCDPTVFAEVGVASVVEAFSEQIRHEQALLHEAENVDSYTYLVLTTERDAGRVVVTVCQRDGIVVFERPPDGKEQLVTDRFVSKIREWHVDPTESGWRIVGATTVEEASDLENDLCAG
ncbi:MAG TPA: hypothetical protein VNQ73_01740 [Ilumatobacter sp.]|nr:hypothetical protein [Ilumatobacter sp.]